MKRIIYHDKVEFIPRITIIIRYINQFKGETSYHYLNNAEKVFDKIQHQCMIKQKKNYLSKLGKERNLCNLVRIIYFKTTVSIFNS